VIRAFLSAAPLAVVAAAGTVADDAYATLSPSAIDVLAEVCSVVSLGVFLVVAVASIRQARWRR
jgi:uncharacterized membrane protein YdfJ with MMPL/SSD domain